jgi:hypothetical protein
MFTRQPSTHPNSGSTFKLPASSPSSDCFEHKDLADMLTKTVTIKSSSFPADMRCAHLQGLGNGGKKVCDEGCYFVERGGGKHGEEARWHCKREDCEGHVYCGKVKEDEDGVCCFGKKGERMVCLEK